MNKIRQYWKEYKWSNVFQMIRNMKQEVKKCEKRADGKFVVITGATSGIGYHAAMKFASMGANLLTINRNKEKSERLKEEILNKYPVEFDYYISDLSILEDIYRVGEFLNKLDKDIDILIHNAGVYNTKKRITKDGFEETFVVHFIAPFIINNMLLEKFNRQGKGRIIFVSSEGYRFAVWGPNLDDLMFERTKYSGLKAYGSAKICQILTMHIYAKLLKGPTIIAMHPGMVRSNTGRDNGKLYKIFKKTLDKLSDSPEISAEALYYLGVSEELENVTDKFYHLTVEEELTPPARDMEVAVELWKKTLELVKFCEVVTCKNEKLLLLEEEFQV
ncbi:retinol dehydrogenase 13, putative [Thermosipho africanus TCF52B]|uniref:Retinol dehydrogenase 13, putative n=1 Tax=Thermosipho africanus (strain TCF52B) TaxID=484019 RepID=B7IGG2_THEAB|nr:SDR family NAD(P)-dependent oxidoreductase [Thermosipho africanus]ACJ75176.1 retinol dehydrogenase 13, putative [Thermosipho africanus TCF52B]